MAWETYENATRAAAKGGITTVVDMPLDKPPTLTAQALRDKLEAIGDECYVDYAAFGGYLESDPEEIASMAAAGAVAFKLFTGGVAPPGMYPGVTAGQMLDAMRRVKREDATVVVHAENAPIVDFETARLKAEGPDGRRRAGTRRAPGSASWRPSSACRSSPRSRAAGR